MKKLIKRIRAFALSQWNRLLNFLFLTVPMVYILYIYYISYHGHNPLQSSIGLLVTFGIFAYAHAKFLRKDHYAVKLRLQVILANAALEAALFAIAMSSLGYKYSSVSFAVAVLIAASLCVLTINEIISGSTEENLYEMLTTFFLVLFAAFFIYQIVILWMTWYVFIPAITGTIMISTIYRNGIVHEKGLPFMIFFTVPIMFGLGIISLILQYFFYKVIWGVELWKLLSGSTVIILAIWGWAKSELSIKKLHAEIDGKEAVR